MTSMLIQGVGPTNPPVYEIVYQSDTEQTLALFLARHDLTFRIDGGTEKVVSQGFRGVFKGKLLEAKSNQTDVVLVVTTSEGSISIS